MKKTKWILLVTILAFLISLLMSILSSLVLKNVTLTITIITTLFFVVIGIIFDIIGVSATCGDITVFNSMSARKIKEGKIGVFLIKNNSKVSSICCDVVGDVCGIVSGATGVVIVTILTKVTNINILLLTGLVSAIISSLTIGGKAIGKELAIKESTKIITIVSKIIGVFKRKNF